MPRQPISATTGRPTVYDWDAHQRALRAHPGQWMMLEPHASSGIASYIRSGRQPDLAPLLGHLDVRMRATMWQGATRYGQLWARWSPGEDIPAKRNQRPDGRADLDDPTVARIREAAASGDRFADIARTFEVSPSHVSCLVRGVYRKHAPGPIRGIDY